MKTKMFDFNNDKVTEKTMSEDLVNLKMRSKFEKPFNIKLDVIDDEGKRRILGVYFSQKISVDASKGVSIKNITLASQSIGGYTKETILYPNIDLIILQNNRYCKVSDIIEGDFVYLK